MANEIGKTESYAYDLSKNIFTKGEIFDTDVIDQSIESILSTLFGERLFVPFFGSEFSLTLFENLTVESGEEMLDSILEAISIWENRIIVFKDQVKLDVTIENNSLFIEIPYFINKLNITSTFKRRIRF